jgi:hypothetical protein
LRRGNNNNNKNKKAKKSKNEKTRARAATACSRKVILGMLAHKYLCLAKKKKKMKQDT